MSIKLYISGRLQLVKNFMSVQSKDNNEHAIAVIKDNQIFGQIRFVPIIFCFGFTLLLMVNTVPQSPAFIEYSAFILHIIVLLPHINYRLGLRRRCLIEEI